MSPLGKILSYIAVAGGIACVIFGVLIVLQQKDDRATITKTTAQLITSQGNEKKAKDQAAALTAQNTDLTTKLTDATGQVSSLTDQLKTAKQQAADATAAVQTATDAAKSAKDELDKIKALLGDETPEQYKADKAKAEADLATAQAEQKVLQDNLENFKQQVADLQDAINRSKVGKNLPGVSGKVTFVDRAWNFVILDVGIAAGVVPNGELIVYRGHNFLGKVRVTKVDPNDSVAEILPDAKGDIQIGDAVLN